MVSAGSSGGELAMTCTAMLDKRPYTSSLDRSYIGLNYAYHAEAFWAGLDDEERLNRGELQMTNGLESIILDPRTRLLAVDFDWTDVGGFESYLTASSDVRMLMLGLKNVLVAEMAGDYPTGSPTGEEPRTCGGTSSGTSSMAVGEVVVPSAAAVGSTVNTSSSSAAALLASQESVQVQQVVHLPAAKPPKSFPPSGPSTSFPPTGGYPSKCSRIFFSCSTQPSSFGVTVYNAIFRARGMDAFYFWRFCDQGGAKALLDSVRALQIAGCSISMPLKSEVCAFLDEVDPAAAAVNSVNSVVNLPVDASDLSKGYTGKLKGYNTDLLGFRETLKEIFVQEGENLFAGKKHVRIVLYGSGSVVNSCLHVLLAESSEASSAETKSEEVVGPSSPWNPQRLRVSVRLAARNAAAAAEKVREFSSGTQKSSDSAGVPAFAAWDPLADEGAHPAEEVPPTIFINATPVSMHPLPGDFVSFLGKVRPLVVQDLVVPAKGNHLLEWCERQQTSVKRYVGGFRMYQHQVCQQFRFYTGAELGTEEVGTVCRERGLI